MSLRNRIDLPRELGQTKTCTGRASGEGPFSGHYCPQCLGSNIRQAIPEVCNAVGNLTQACLCVECDKEWINVYSFSWYVDPRDVLAREREEREARFMSYEPPLDLVYAPIDHGSDPSELQPGNGCLGEMYYRSYAKGENGLRIVSEWKIIRAYDFQQLCRGDVKCFYADRSLFTVHVNQYDWFQLRVRREDCEAVETHLKISMDFTRAR